MNQLLKAQGFIETHKSEVNSEFRNQFHPMPPYGWMNDPNGFAFFNGKYHLFYQHNPYAPKWGKMYWGHMVSSDLVKWDHMPIALAPDKKYEGLLGCFSGTSMVINTELNVFYTGVGISGQHQCRAVSKNGIDFIKYDKPFIPVSAKPEGSKRFSFRDPKIICRNGVYYCFLGSGYKEGKSLGGQICTYSSNDLLHWERLDPLIIDTNLRKGIFECPDIANVDGTDIVFASLMYYKRKNDPRFQNLHSSVYFTGRFDEKTGGFIKHCHDFDEIDNGPDFYAPQTLTLEDGRVIMIAWANGWKRTIPSAYLGHKWAGCMTIPRELYLKGNILIQKPIRELISFRKNQVLFERIVVTKDMHLNGIFGKRIEIILDIDMSQGDLFSVKLRSSADCGTVISYDKKSQLITFDRGESGREIKSLHKDEVSNSKRNFKLYTENNMLKMHILLDTSIIEVFLQDGQKTITSTIYPKSTAEDIVFNANGRIIIKKIEKYDIIV